MTKKPKRRAPPPVRRRASPPTPPIIAPVQIPIREAIREGLQLSLPSGYDLIASGKLRTYLIGRRRYTTPADLAACVELLRTEGGFMPDGMTPEEAGAAAATVAA